MPHYKDGQEAKVGDVVRLPESYHRWARAATVLHIVPDATSCNAVIAFAREVPAEELQQGMSWSAPVQAMQMYRPMLLQACATSATCSELELLDRAAEAAAAPTAGA